jgi:hypothetical protein
VTSTATGERLLAAIAARDGEAIGACFAEDASLRVLNPRGLSEDEGREAVRARYDHWFGNLAGFEVLEGDATEIADRLRVRYRIRGRHPERGWWTNEHTAYAVVEDGRVRSMTLTCTGFRPTERPA